MNMDDDNTILNMNSGQCITTNLMVNDRMIFCALSQHCYIWFDFRHTKRHYVRFEVEHATKLGELKKKVVLTDYRSIVRFLEEEHPVTLENRIKNSAGKGLMVENCGDGTYNLMVNGEKLYAPSTYVDEDKLAEALIDQMYPQFHEFKKEYLSSQPIKILLMSAANVLPSSVNFLDFGIVVILESFEATQVHSYIKNHIAKGVGFKAFYSKRNLEKWDKYLIKNIGIDLNQLQ